MILAKDLGISFKNFMYETIEETLVKDSAKTDNRNFFRGLLLILTTSILIPAFFLAIINLFFQKNVFQQVPLHSLIECMSSFSMLCLALLLWLIQKDTGNDHYMWFSCGLISFGVLILYHGAIQPGNVFVWFYCLSTLTGSMFFALIWISSFKINRKFLRILSSGNSRCCYYCRITAARHRAQTSAFHRRRKIQYCGQYYKYNFRSIAADIRINSIFCGTKTFFRQKTRFLPRF